LFREKNFIEGLGRNGQVNFWVVPDDNGTEELFGKSNFLSMSPIYLKI